MKNTIKAIQETGESVLSGRDYAPKYVVEMTLWDKKPITPMSWDKGKPTAKKLKDFCEKYNESLEEGEVNEHLGLTAMCVKAFIRENRVGAKPIVTWKMKNVPMFLASASKDWDSKFLSPDNIVGDRRFKYVPFHELSSSDQSKARRMYPNKSTGAKYDFRDEHYYYPVKNDGTLGNASRFLAIPYKLINDEKYMEKLGYTINPEWGN